MRARLLVVLLAGAEGCAATAPPAVGGPARASPPSVAAAIDGGAFVYGFLQVPAELGLPTCVAVIEADRERVAGGRHGCAATSPDGLFWLQDARPIRWAVEGVQVGGTFRRFALPLTVAGVAGALQDVGTFRVTPTGTAGGGRPGAELSPATAPGRAEVLRRLLAKEGISARWRERIAEALRRAE